MSESKESLTPIYTDVGGFPVPSPGERQDMYSPTGQEWQRGRYAAANANSPPPSNPQSRHESGRLTSEQSSCSGYSSVSSGKQWQRASGRYDMKAMPLSEGLPLSPSTLQIAAIDDSDPGRWHTTSKEDDDFLHDVDTPDRGSILSARGLMNLGTLAFLALGIAMLFMGYPVLREFYFNREGKKGGYGLGGSNGTGQIPDLTHLGFRASLVDQDTPSSALTADGHGRNSDETWNLQWSDEFETAGRSFYPGDDPFWEAINLWAHGTGDYEWYDPAAVTTKDGAMVISCTQQPIHDLNFRSGHVTTWNKLCFTGGYLEVAVILPGSPKIAGWWPAVWMMGNLGRANFGATTEGMWPYTYDKCDAGALINQTNDDGLGPPAALLSGGETMFNDKYHTKSLSFMPGQRLSACTCAGEDHPGPRDKNGNYRGRGAPEIDLFEAQVDEKYGGGLSCSGQFMPANSGYWLNNGSGTEVELNEVNGKKVALNIYRGNVLQQSASGVIATNQQCYEASANKYSIFGVEYEPGDNGYITWWIDGVKAWTLHASAVGADAKAQIGQRPIPNEPMYIIANLALSSGFGWIDFDKLVFPGKMKIDYMRLYQAKGKENVGCDPKDYPTKDYIERHLEAYTNPNLTVWGGTPEEGGYGQFWPRNKLYDGGNGCSSPPGKHAGNLRVQNAVKNAALNAVAAPATDATAATN